MIIFFIFYFQVQCPPLQIQSDLCLQQVLLSVNNTKYRSHPQPQITMKKWPYLIGLVGLIGLFECTGQAALASQAAGLDVAPETVPAMQIDHVILAVTDLEAGMREFEELTGVEPVYGGRHPGRDTHNAIVPLTSGMYVEILAPKDELEVMPEFFQGFQQLTLIRDMAEAFFLDKEEDSHALP